MYHQSAGQSVDTGVNTAAIRLYNPLYLYREVQLYVQLYGCTAFLVERKSRTLELLDFDEYCRFYIFALLGWINRASLYSPK
jgi:hypothetical protein